MTNTHFLLASTAATISPILLFLSPLISASSPVLDTTGNPLEPSSKYYVTTSGRGAAGRGDLVAASKGPGLCPFYVGQLPKEFQRGKPVMITPSNTTQKEITLGMNVNIAFGGNPCRNEGIWKLSVFSDEYLLLVSNDGTQGDRNSSPEAFASTFQIRETSPGARDYKLVFCFLPVTWPIWPPVPPMENCGQLDATVKGSNGLSWLTVEPIDNALPFFGITFVKVEEGSSTY